MYTYVHMSKERALKCVCMGVVGGGLWHIAPRAGHEHLYIGSGSGGLGLGNPIIKKVVFLCVTYVTPVVPECRYIYIYTQRDNEKSFILYQG